MAQQRTAIHPTQRYAVFYEAPGIGFPLIPGVDVVDSVLIQRYADSTAAWLKQNPSLKEQSRKQQRDSVMLRYDQVRQISLREKSGERTLFHGAQLGLKVQRALRAGAPDRGKPTGPRPEEAGDVYFLSSRDFQRLKAEFK